MDSQGNTLAETDMLLEDDLIVARDDERATFELLAELIENRPGRDLSVITSGNQQAALPNSLLPLLARIARALAAGDLVTIRTLDQLLSPAEAAALLDLSVSDVLCLLESGALTATDDDRAIRIKFADLAAFSASERAEQRNALRTLTRMSEELGLYEDEYRLSSQ